MPAMLSGHIVAIDVRCDYMTALANYNHILTVIRIP
jgi:hypothetical protein